MRLNAAWLSYKAEVLPPDAPPIQISECRLAFYAGAASCMAEIMKTTSPAIADELLAELERWNEKVKRGEHT